MLSYVVAAISLTSQVAIASEQKLSFNEYVQQLKTEAIEKGYAKPLVDAAFKNVTYRKKVVKADKTQPEFVQTLDTYLPKRVNNYVVNKAKKLATENRELLKRISDHYGVQPRFIVSIWALESSFGKHQGKIPVISALTTLAYDGRREALFKKNIYAALDIATSEKINIQDLKGSWAGAMGQTQFMPTSYMAYAQDFDGDGRKDIWRSKADVFASIANYLKTEGWDNSLTWGRQVKLPKEFDMAHAIPRGTKSRKDWLEKWSKTELTLPQWNELGLRRMNGKPLPNREIKAALVFPDDKNGRAYLIYDNYKTLMHWNRSYYFATTIGYLADRIKNGMH